MRNLTDLSIQKKLKIILTVLKSKEIFTGNKREMHVDENE